MLYQRWFYLLAAALAADLVLSGAARLDSLRALVSGTRDLPTVVGVADLAAVAVAIVAGLAIMRSSCRTRSELDRRSQVIAADASLSPDWLWETDLEGRITYSSAGVQQLLGYDPDLLVGTLSSDLLFDGPEREKLHSRLEHSRHTGVGWESVAAVWRHSDGSAVALRGAAVPLHHTKGRAVGYRGTRSLVVADAESQSSVCAAHARIRQVLAGDGFDIALQPLVSLATGRITGVEALARFHDGRTPDRWFQDARDCGRSLDLEARTFAAAIRLADQVPHQFYLSVNASPELLMDEEFGESLRDCTALPQLVIEITEHARVADYSELSAAVSRLRALGVRFAIDDTGAGYASLNHVLQLRPDIIKLDRALIARLDGDRARRSLVTALVLLALDIGAAVTGEGVESVSQIDALTTLGVDQAQGYAFAKPTTDQGEWRRWWRRRWLSIPSDQVIRTP